MKPLIEKIVFNVHGKRIELSQDEAKELKMILSDLFGETKVVHEYHTWPYHHWNTPIHPWITYTGTGQTGTFSGNITDTVTNDTIYLNAN